MRALYLRPAAGLWPAAAAFALLAGCGIGAPAYPTFGEASYRIEGLAATPEGSTVPTVIYRDGSKMRVETTLADNTRAIIVNDQATNVAYVLNPTAPAAMPSTVAPVQGQSLPPPQGAAPAPNAPASVTGATTTTTTTTAQTTAAANALSPPAQPPPQILGVATRVSNEDAPQPLEASWAALGKDSARSDGDCEAAGVRGHEWRPREASQGVERTACITADGIVLRLREGDRVLFEATRLDRGPQQAALFGVPPGYQVIDPAAVAEQVGDTMQNLDSVTGAQPTTPTTQAPPRRPNG